ncbi:MAG: hypothetical protein BGN96_13895 [Bacteroidales bacterium 45-6]|nr:MAG: hypothetical protein BGN96_13895 [Bacteroidales bacterium 45-6]
MEMPVPCDKCNEWVELNDTRESPLKKGRMLCRNCFSDEYEVKNKIDEIESIQYMLDNNDPEVKGNRLGWKSNIKQLRSEMSSLGYDPEEYLR